MNMCDQIISDRAISIYMELPEEFRCVLVRSLNHITELFYLKSVHNFNYYLGIGGGVTCPDSIPINVDGVISSLRQFLHGFFDKFYDDYDISYKDVFAVCLRDCGDIFCSTVL